MLDKAVAHLEEFADVEVVKMNEGEYELRFAHELTKRDRDNIRWKSEELGLEARTRRGELIVLVAE